MENQLLHFHPSQENENRDEIIDGATRFNDIAIIGMSCRFPGGVNSPTEFFDFLLQAGDGIVPVPTNRWENSAYYDSSRERKNRMFINRGGFIQNIDKFDPLFFGISPAEATKIDPQHRWLLELTYEAIENAGLKAKDIKGSDTAVYIGQFMHDYEQLQLDSRAKELLNNHTATGPFMTMSSNRISYTFDFRGPSVSLDTACSSSMVAIDLACKALLNGDSALAVAGGVNILLRPESTMALYKASMLSPDGRCKSFDASANGYVRSEGAGILLLKRLADAQRDGDPIWAVIKASGTNQDGQTLGITVPSGEAQTTLLLKSLKQSGLTGDDIQYIEAHGTGTAVGDPTEVNGLGSVLGKNRKDGSECIIGSVKSNIGHAEAAAGIAGVIKTVMAIRYGVIPQNLHLHNINPAINQQDFKLRFADRTLPWPECKGPRRALVNSFGFGGTNANVILEQAPLNSADQLVKESEKQHIKLLPISSKTENGLRDQAARYRAFFAARDLARQSNGALLDSLDDICFTAATKREHYKYRLIVNGATEEEMVKNLDLFLRGEPAIEGWVSGLAASDVSPNLCFVYSGMGTQWANMGHRLYKSEPVFREILDRCSAALEPYTGWSLIDALFLKSEHSIEDTYVAQPGIFSVQAALTGLLKSWGIEPGAVVGHSVGEVCASYAAGALDFEDAIRVIYHRSRLQQTAEGTGKMLAVGLTATMLRPYLVGLDQKVSIAAINSENAITLAGDEGALAQIASKLEDEGVFARFLKVGVPYHSQEMDRIKAPLIQALSGIKVNTPRIPLYSTVSGKRTQEGDWGPEYWAQNIRQPVLFQAAIQSLTEDGFSSFLEIAPNGALASSIEKNLSQAQVKGWVVSTLKRDADDSLMLAAALGNLHAKGWPLDWERLLLTGRFVILPNYAWQYDSYWSEAADVQRSRLKNVNDSGGFSDPVHPLLGGKLQSSALFWQNKLDVNDLSFLADHQVENEPVYPAAGYIEMFMAVVNPDGAGLPIHLDDVEFKRALFLDREKLMLLQTTMSEGENRLSIHAMDAQTNQWNLYSQATWGEATGLSVPIINLAETKARLGKQLDHTQFYVHCHELGLTYQNAFQAVQAAWLDDNEALVEVFLAETVADDKYQLHPSLLDGCFQAVYPAIENKFFLPVRMGTFRYYRKPENHCFCLARLGKRSSAEIKYDLWIVNSDGVVAIEIFDFEMRPTKVQVDATDNTDSMLYEYSWQRVEPVIVKPSETAQTDGTWLVLADSKGIATQLVSELKSRFSSVTLIEVGKSQVDGETGAASATIYSRDNFVSRLAPFAADCCGIIYLRALDVITRDEQNGDAVFEQCCFTSIEPTHLAQALDQIEWRKTLRVYFVTQSVQTLDDKDAAPQPAQGALWGMARVFALEYPSFKISLLDLPELIDNKVIQRFADEVLFDEHEPEIAIRANGRYVNRLRPLTESLLRQHSRQPFIPSSHSPFQITPNHHSIGSNRFDVTALQLPMLPAQAVEIKVDAAAWRLSNVLKNKAVSAQETRFTHGLVSSISGVITSAGSELTSYLKGDCAVGFSLGELGSLVQVPVDLIVKVTSQRFSSEELCAIPAVFLPAYFALEYIGLLRKGEHVLIHDADQAIGLAAVQFAKLSGAVIYATARNLDGCQKLLELGVHAAYQFDDYAMYEKIYTATGCRGLDLVLDALPGGRSLTKSLEILKPYGRYVDLSQKPLLATEFLSSKSVSYHRVELNELVAQRPDLCGRLLTEIVALFDAGQLQPIKLKTFSLDQLDEAADFLQMHGSLQVAALSFTEPPMFVAAGTNEDIVKANRTYLITGGMGALGLEVMRWLVDQGARSIMLTGRSAPSSQTQQMIDVATAQGCTITIFQADVSQADDVARALRHIETYLPPLAGIVHAAGIVAGGVISQQTAERFQQVLAPKVKGVWNLHQLTTHLPLDFFVCFSSVASVVGIAGQSNYAAANAFMDTFVHRRRASGRFATSINWGPWSDSGMAARLEIREQRRMKNSGLNALSAKQSLGIMEQLLKYRAVQAGVFDIDWELLFGAETDTSRFAVFSDLVSNASKVLQTSAFERIKAAPIDERETLVASEISSVLADVLGMGSGNTIDLDKNIVDYGVNSLMSMDIRNRLQTVLNVKLPATFTLKYGTVNTMVAYILENLSIESAEKFQDVLYWDPKEPDFVPNTEQNGRLATLTPSNLHWIFEGHTTHYNEAFLFEINDEDFDLQVFKTALKIMLIYHDAVRSEIFEEGGQLQQEIVSLNDHVEVAEYDFTGLGYEAGAAKMLECNNELQRSFRFERGCSLYRVAYYKLDDKAPHRIFLLFHHYLLDASAMLTFWHNLLQTYSKVINQELVFLSPKKYSYADWTNQLYNFAHEDGYAQLPYWLEKIDKSQACFIPDDFESKQARTIDDYTNLTETMDRESYARVADFCRAKNYEVSDLCTYALIKAFSRLTGSETLWTEIVSHARFGIFPDVSIPDLFGQVCETASILFELVPNGTLDDQLMAIRRQRTESPNGGIGLRALRFLNKTPEVLSKINHAQAPQVGLNFVLVDFEQSKNGKFRFARESIGVKQIPHIRKKEVRLTFFFNFWLRDGIFSVEIQYYRDRFYKSTVEHLAQDFFAVIKDAVE